MSNIKWNEPKSVLTHGGRDYKHGDIIPTDILESMGKERVKDFMKKGTLTSGKVDNAKTEEETQRLELLEQARRMGLNPQVKTGIKKLQAAIDEETKRLELLEQVKVVNPDVANDLDTVALQAILDNESNN